VALATLAMPIAVAQTATFATLYNFHGADGAAPQAGVIADVSGNHYGTTYAGGAAKHGTVFELSPPSGTGGPWTENLLYSFLGTPDGQNPGAGLAFGPSGSSGPQAAPSSSSRRPRSPAGLGPRRWTKLVRETDAAVFLILA